MANVSQIIERISARRYSAIDTVFRLRQLIPTVSSKLDQREIQALTLRIILCNSKKNFWLYPGEIETATGSHTPSGKFWSCNSKLCASCLADQSRRHRSKLFAALSNIPNRSKSKFYFVTLTIPNPDVSLCLTRRLVNRAWSLLRKRQSWRVSVIGGVKSEEFTVTSNGFHYHLHLIIQARYINYDVMRVAWTDCVAEAFHSTLKRRMEMPKTKDGFLIIKCVLLADPFDAVNEVCKYITKSDSWLKLSGESLIEIAMIRRWSRMFEMFGSFRSQKSATVEDVVEDDAIVHTTCLSDGSNNPDFSYWRDYVWRYGLNNYRQRLIREFDSCVIVRSEQLHELYDVGYLPTYHQFLIMTK